MTMQVDGKCHCGFIAFQAEADPEKTRVCHCTDCQTLTGTAFRTVVVAEMDSFKLLAGEPASYIKTAESGNKRVQAFCPKCGSSIYATAAGDGPKAYGLRVGILRQRDQFVPKRQIWARSAQTWATLADMPSAEKQ
jgi:hypothetical protein